MLQITTKTDMIGSKSLNISNADTANFNSIVVETEEQIARDLLGDALFNAFETDVDAGSGTPTQAKHLAILNGVTWVDDETSTEDVTYNLEGLKEAWKYFVYYEWLDQVPYVNNFIGKAKNISENSELMDRQGINAESQNRYNKGVVFYNNLVRFVEFYETYKADATSIVESPAGTYTVTIADTTYLIDGDTVTIDGEDYTVANLIADTSFEFSATAGLTFSDLEVTWHPFEDALMAKKDKIFFNGMI